MWQFSFQWWWLGAVLARELYLGMALKLFLCHFPSSCIIMARSWLRLRLVGPFKKQSRELLFSFSCWWCISFFRCQQSRAMCQLVLWMRKQVYYQIWLCRQGRLELWQGAGVVKLSFYRSNPGERTTVPAGIPYSTQHITHIFHIPPPIFTHK